MASALASARFRKERGSEGEYQRWRIPPFGGPALWEGIEEEKEEVENGGAPPLEGRKEEKMAAIPAFC